MTPEDQVRIAIDIRLAQSGWLVRDMLQLNLGACLREAVRGYPANSGPVDYVLFVERQAVDVIEAKCKEAGENIAAVDLQTERYATATLRWRHDETTLPLLFKATCESFRFTDSLDPAPRSRAIFLFLKPETLNVWLLSAGKKTTNPTSINMTMLRVFPVPLAPFDKHKEVLVQLQSRLFPPTRSARPGRRTRQRAARAHLLRTFSTKLKLCQTGKHSSSQFS